MKPQPRFEWRHQYDMIRDQQEGDAAATTCADEHLTQQQFREDCDLNVIVKRFGIEKAPIPIEAFDPSHYGDLSDVPDLRTLLDIANDAKNRFMELPPKLRQRFNNQPAQLWAFVTDPDNAEESVRLGLLAKPPDPQTNTGSEIPEPENTPTP